jgi:hypothetical protein
VFDLERLELDLRLGEDDLDLDLRPPGEEERDLDLDELDRATDARLGLIDLEGDLEPALSSCCAASSPSSG